MTRMIGLVTEAYGGRGGIAQATRDFIDAVATHDNITQIDLFVRLGSDPVADMPAKVRQAPARQGRTGYTLQALAAARQKADVIYCNHLYMAPLARIVARLARARLVIHLHGIEVWGVLKPQWRRALEAADLVICVSRDTRRRVLSQACLAPERVVVLNNTVDERFNPGDRNAARTKFGLGREFVLLTVGRLSSREQYKGHDKVLAALPTLTPSSDRPLRYLIAGDGDDSPRLERIARDRGVAASVTFLGHVKHDDLPDLYRAADVFVMPSEGEGFGIAFLEAMSSGTPAIGLEAGGAPDALGDGDLGCCIGPAELSDELNRQISGQQGDLMRLAVRVRERFGRSVFQAQAIAALDRLVGCAAYERAV